MMKCVSRLAPAALLGACALQPAYQPPVLETAGSWANAAAKPASASEGVVGANERWWTALGDPAVDAFVAAGLRDNPTLGEAAARVDQARAVLKLEQAQRQPRVGLNGGVSRSRDVAGAGSGAVRQTAATVGPNLSWELDLWGRVRETTLAAASRLDARTADARYARLSIAAQIADGALRLRSCDQTLNIRARDIVSREVELSITRQRLVFGAVAPVSVAAAQSSLASAQTERMVHHETCVRIVDELVSLSGLDAGAVRALSPVTSLRALATPHAPPFSPALPASVLAGHPGVVAAEREVAARWSEIAVARAERLPRIDLAATLTGQWLRALGSSSSYRAGSLGADLTFPLIDGGAGAANLGAAEARYREAAAMLTLTLRAAVREIEDGLAAQQSAIARVETSQLAVDAARFTFAANEARWRAGSIALFELEDSRRQLNRAEESAVAAAGDRARAWVELVRRTGPGWNAPETLQAATASPTRLATAKLDGPQQ